MRIWTASNLLWRAYIRRDEEARYQLAEKLAGLIDPGYKFSEFGRVYLKDYQFLRTYEDLVGKTNYHSLDRKYALAELLKLTEQVPGDTAECGVFEGASSYFICSRIAGSGKKHHVFDSFEGLSEPDQHDGHYWKRGTLAASEERVRANLKAFDFVLYYKGWIPQQFSDVATEDFSFVHLDVDLYQPTLDSLRFFYDRVRPRGIILCDDYGFITCPGARQAMDTFFLSKREKIVCLPTGQGFVQKLG
jgi:O-methyltransferase